MIDWARIRDLQDEIGEDGFAEVVELFLTETGAVVARLHDPPDPGMLEADLHFLKGGVLNLGFTQVASLCQQGEAMAARGEAEQIDLTGIIQAYEQARSLFMRDMSGCLSG